MTYEIKQYHGKYNIQKRTVSVKYIVIHYVGAGTSAAGSALANCKYFAGGNRNASAHYFIDDEYIYEYANPCAYATWHCGDGRGKYGITNSNSIGIEVCNNGGPYTSAEIDRLTFLVQKLMQQFKVSPDCVVRHYDASRKQCPLYYVQHADEWTQLRNQITGGKVTASAPAVNHVVNANTNASVDLGDTNWTGPKMVKLLQQQLKCPYVDGAISGQTKYNADTVQWAITVSPASAKPTGSVTVKKLQAFLNAKGFNCGAADGHMGKNTVKALQRWLNSTLGANLAVDGYYGHATSRAVGTALTKRLFA